MGEESDYLNDAGDYYAYMDFCDKERRSRKPPKNLQSARGGKLISRHNRTASAMVTEADGGRTIRTTSAGRVRCTLEANEKTA